MAFPGVMYGCENWTIKKAEGWKIDAFELWCWRRLLRIPWTARRSNQSILNKISPEYLLEGLMFKLKLQYFSYLMWRTEKDWRREEKGTTEDEMVGWHHRLNGHEWVWVNSGSWCWTGQGSLVCCSHGEAKSRTRLMDWTEQFCLIIELSVVHIVPLSKHLKLKVPPSPLTFRLRTLRIYSHSLHASSSPSFTKQRLLRTTEARQ